MASIFTNASPSIANQLITTDPGGLADFLIPNGPGGIDVVNDYRWTLSSPAARTETPYAVLTEFRLLQSSLINSARYYVTGAQQQIGGSDNAFLNGQQSMRGYQGLFDFQNPTGFWYKLPYFSEVANEVSSTWTSLDILEKVKGALGALSPALSKALDVGVAAAGTAYEANYPRVGVMDRPKLWEQSSPRSINIKFPLFNTYEFSDIQKNWELVYLLLYQNMFNKRDFVTAIPPCFYTIWIPGQFFTIAAYVSDMKVYNRGNLRQMTIDGKRRNIPDVYEVDMTFTDMVMPSQNMLKTIERDSPITVFERNEDGTVTSL